MSIRLKLAILFMPIALVPMLLVAILTFDNYKRSLESTHIADLQDIAAFQAERIAAHLNGSAASAADIASIFKLTQNAPGLGNSGEVVLAKKEGDQLVYLNPLKYASGSGFQYKVKLGSRFALPMQDALQGKTGEGVTIDYRGREVIAAWRYIPALNLGLVAKIDTSEAFADIARLKKLTAIILIIISIIAGILAVLVARSISAVIAKISDGIAIVGQGNLDHKVSFGARDEIGRLSRAFDKMTQDLRNVTASRNELNREITMRKGMEEELFRLNRILKENEQALKQSHDELEQRVTERTVQLADAQKEVDRSKRLSDIGALAATVAHELRNPLASVKMAVYNIKRKAKNPLLEKHLDNIELKVDESEQIINNLLFYSRLKTPHYEKINIYNTLNSCLDEATAMFPRTKAHVERRTEALKGLLVEADPLQMKEVFSNILNNAYDALLEREGKIVVTAQADNLSVTIVVEDEGAGIHVDDLARLFEPFFTTKSKGIGLGLSVSRQIVNLHGGSINIESAKGRGAVVTVCLPIARKKNG